MNKKIDITGYKNFIEEKLWITSDESTDEISETEYYSPRFGGFNDSEELTEEIQVKNETKIENSVDEFCEIVESDIYLSSEKESENGIVETLNDNTQNEWNIQKRNENSSTEIIDNDYLKLYDQISVQNQFVEETQQLGDSKSNKIKCSEEKLDNTLYIKSFASVSEKSIQVSLEYSDQESKYYEDLQAQMKSLLEVSNKHQEEVHAQLDNLMENNNKLKEEIELSNLKLKENELEISQYKLNSMALAAQLPFLKSRIMLDEDKEELNYLRSKITELESKLKNSEIEMEKQKIYKERASFLESELERITNEFSELERFQTEQLRIADSEIIALTETKNTLFKEIHSIMRENDSLKLTKSVLKRMETYYKNIKDEIVLPNIETKLEETLNSLIEDKEDVIEPQQSSFIFEICQSIIPRLAYDIAEEIVYTFKDDNSHEINKNKRSLTKKNISIQVGFPLLHGSTLEASNTDISSKGELIALKAENNKLKKENQKLKQDIFLMKRIKNRSKDTNKTASKEFLDKPSSNLGETCREESMLNGIKWLTSVVNEIDELEQRCNNINIKNNSSKNDTRRSSAYNSTVASFEDIENVELRDHSKNKIPVNNELTLLREKLINEGILNEL